MNALPGKLPLPLQERQLWMLAGLVAAAQGGSLSYPALKSSFKEAVQKDPFDTAVATVLGGAFLFWVAERGHNPKVESYWDALIYTSTCLSVGYSDVFARTPAGKAIGTTLMTIGPSLAAKLLDPTAAQQATEDAKLQRTQELLLGKLDEILQELKASRSRPGGA